MITNFLPILFALVFIIGLPIAIKLDEHADYSIKTMAKKLIEDIENHKI